MDARTFVARWRDTEGGAERANYALFLGELAAMLGLPAPDPGVGGKLGRYQFEGYVRDPTTADKGFIDLYKHDCFILEAKQSRIPRGKPADLFDPAPAVPAAPSRVRYDKLMIGALAQAKGYAVALPPDHPWPPFLIVCDVGRAFELYFDFAGNGRGYDYFPNAREYRIPLERLRDPDTQALFRTLWTEPRTLDPRTKAADVTRAVAARLADISRYVDEWNRAKGGYATVRDRAMGLEHAALFIMRLLFCMFAEDVGLLPKGSFTNFLASCLPPQFDATTEGVKALKLENGLRDLWRAMASPHGRERYAHAVECEVRYFNGGLFEENFYFPLQLRELRELHNAANQNWAKVEPAIFGTLLEQALSTTERARLGAHYTPRPYVERLVRATVMDVLEAEWREAEAAIAALVDTRPDEALARAVAFHVRLKALRVLDPACGTGNFLYVAMELILALEARVREAIASLGGYGEPGVLPDQFLGLELNPRAAVIADLLVWIGWLRWRAENIGGEPAEPVLRRTNAINGGDHGGYDALLRCDDAGEPVADPAPWPDADFIVGNPPFIGKGQPMRAALGDAYVEMLGKAYPAVPGSADLVMYWWERAADALTKPGARLKRFGFVTTNSITQTFNRRVVERHLSPPPCGEGLGGGALPGAGVRSPSGVTPTQPSPQGGGLSSGSAASPRLSLVMAIPDHPWIKAAKKARRAKGAPKESDPAAVRIAMTVAEAGAHAGCLLEVVGESALDTDTPRITTEPSEGRINADLTVGADVTGAVPLRANDGLSCNGIMLAGAGFKLEAADAAHLIARGGKGVERIVRPYVGGGELVHRAEGRFVIDLFGLSEKDARTAWPDAYQHLLRHVKPERDSNRDATFRERWWLFGRSRPELRAAAADLPRFIATIETSKHRVFQFLDTAVLPDHMVIAIALSDGFHLGVLSSRVHTEWTLRAGGWLGMGNDNRYNKSKVFDPFPFPDATPAQRDAIAALADELDATRKAALAEHPRLTMTGLYNLVALIRAATPLGPAQETDARDARAWIVRDLHDRLDTAVAAAYGWPASLPAPQIVARLVALNAERAAEERSGTVRWLRPDYQAPR